MRLECECPTHLQSQSLKPQNAQQRARVSALDMEFINQTYFALRGPQGAPQSAPETIARLADRLSPSTLLADRRAAVLSLKGLSRDHRADVGQFALTGLIDVLLNDAEIDADIGKAVLETLNVLCEAEDTASPQARELGFRHTDQVLKDEKVAHKLFALLADISFYLRVSILQFLSTLLQNRRQVVQGYFLNAPVGPTSFVSVLEEKREIIRHGMSVRNYVVVLRRRPCHQADEFPAEYEYASQPEVAPPYRTEGCVSPCVSMIVCLAPDGHVHLDLPFLMWARPYPRSWCMRGHRTMGAVTRVVHSPRD